MLIIKKFVYYCIDHCELFHLFPPSLCCSPFLAPLTCLLECGTSFAFIRVLTAVVLVTDFLITFILLIANYLHVLSGT